MPYQSSDPLASFKGTLQRAGCPITLGIIITSAVLFLIDFFGRGVVTQLVACQIIDHSVGPIWSPLVYPLANGGFISMVFACMWLWFIGGSLERSWGAQRYSLYLLAATLSTVLTIWIGCALLRSSYVLVGPWYVLTVLTVSWATLNPRVTVNLYGLIPVPAWAIAAFEVGIVYFVYLGQSPILGLFGLIPSALGWWYVGGGFSNGYKFRGYARRGPDLRMSSTPRPLDGSPRSPFNLSAWLKDRAEKRKLRKLWRNSGFNDKDFRG
jgi:membrane associated rhomboid family serine protease